MFKYLPLGIESRQRRAASILDFIRGTGLTPVQAFVKSCELIPDFFRLFYPKIYEHIGDDWTSLKQIAALLCDVGYTVLETRDVRQLSAAHTLLARPLADMVRHKMPTFFVTRDLATAVAHTEYKEELDFVDMHLPFEAGVFVLPKGVLVHPQHGDCGFIVWGRCKPGVDYSYPGYENHLLHGNFNSFVLATAALYERDELPWFHFSMADKLADDNAQALLEAGIASTRRFRIPELTSVNVHIPIKTQWDEPLAQTDDDFLDNVIRIGMNLLILMTARPQLISQGECRKRVKGKHGGPPREFWNPHILGKTFVVRRQQTSGEGSGRSVRGYWVPGHLKSQAHGPKHSLRKTIWIEPYWVDSYGE